MVIGFTGRWAYKQNNASKPSKYHIKTFCLCDSNTGYVVNLLTYFGSETSYRPLLDADSGQAKKIFHTLMEPLGSGHHIYDDRYYTTYELIEFLLSRKTNYTGTVQTKSQELS